MTPNRSQLSLLVAAVAFVAIAGGGASLAQPTTPKDPHAHHKAEACSKACHECQRVCDTCADHCAVMASQGKTEHLKSMRTCQDCAAFCEMAGRISARPGPFLDLAMTSCAEACNRCAQKCEEFPTDAHMKACAEECRRCEQACRKMVATEKTSTR